MPTHTSTQRQIKLNVRKNVQTYIRHIYTYIVLNCLIVYDVFAVSERACTVAYKLTYEFSFINNCSITWYQTCARPPRAGPLLLGPYIWLTGVHQPSYTAGTQCTHASQLPISPILYYGLYTHATLASMAHEVIKVNCTVRRCIPHDSCMLWGPGHVVLPARLAIWPTFELLLSARPGPGRPTQSVHTVSWCMRVRTH